MGCYINPPNVSKEMFLAAYGRLIEECDAEITADEMPVCFIDNGPFTAAGVAFSNSEIKEFQREDGREKTWYMVRFENLKRVSDVENWVR